MRGWLRLAAVLALAVGPAAAQSVQQAGTVTAGHAPVWIRSGIVQDAGTAATGKLSSLGVYGLGGFPFCITNSATPGPFSGNYTQLCAGADLSSAYFDVVPYGGSPLPLNFRVNGASVLSLTPAGLVLPAPLNVANGGTGLSLGVANGWPYWTSPTGMGVLQIGTGLAIAGGVLRATGAATDAVLTTRLIANGTSDTAQSSDVAIMWASAATAAKTQTVFTCNSGTAGRMLWIADDAGTSQSYPITIAPATGTINGSAAFVLRTNRSSLQIVCDGNANWVVF